VACCLATSHFRSHPKLLGQDVFFCTFFLNYVFGYVCWLWSHLRKHFSCWLLIAKVFLILKQQNQGHLFNFKEDRKKKIICPTDAFFYDHSKNETISGVLDLESQCLEWVSKEVSRIFQVRAQYRTLFFHLLSYWKVSGEKYHWMPSLLLLLFKHQQKALLYLGSKTR